MRGGGGGGGGGARLYDVEPGASRTCREEARRRHQVPPSLASSVSTNTNNEI